MNRRFEFGPILVALGAVLLLVSLFLRWYGPLTAWDAFEVVDVLLGILAVVALLAALGTFGDDGSYVDRRWLPGVVLAAAALVAAEIIDPPPAAADLDADTGAWLAFGAAIVMLAGAILTLGRVSLSLTIEGRDRRQRVAAVDERQQTTESGAVVARRAEPAPRPDEPTPRPDEPTEPTEPVAPHRRGSRAVGGADE